MLLKEIFDFKVAEIATILNVTEGVVKHTLLDARKIMQDIFDHRCSLINKNGACHQCSELNGLFNPKQDFQEQKVKTGLEAKNGTRKKSNFLISGRGLQRQSIPISAKEPIAFFSISNTSAMC